MLLSHPSLWKYRPLASLVYVSVWVDEGVEWENEETWEQLNCLEQFSVVGMTVCCSLIFIDPPDKMRAVVVWSWGD
jgi:hypothetical protein